MKCNTYDIGYLWDYKFVVVFAHYHGKWIFCKHKKRDTWETAGGHIEQGETPLDAAKRELFEETGSTGFDIEPICDYWACDEPHETRNIEWSNGVVYFARVHTLGELPESEMERIDFFDSLPESLTYPDITPKLFPYAIDVVKSENIRL